MTKLIHPDSKHEIEVDPGSVSVYETQGWLESEDEAPEDDAAEDDPFIEDWED